jgi:hypothetical protein
MLKRYWWFALIVALIFLLAASGLAHAQDCATARTDEGEFSVCYATFTPTPAAPTATETPRPTATATATPVPPTNTPTRTPTNTTAPTNTLTPVPPASVSSTQFYRGINLNGPAVTIDGNAWAAGATATNWTMASVTLRGC